MICLIIKKARREGFVGKNKIIGWRENNACVCLCVWVCVYANYILSPQASMKSVWNPFFPKLINQNSATDSQCKRQITFENPP